MLNESTDMHSTDVDAPDGDQHQHGITWDQQTFLMDLYRNAAKGPTYGTTAGQWQ